MNIWNLSTAIQDPRLCGESLIVPLRQTIHAYQKGVAKWPENLSLDQKISEVFKRVFFIVASLFSIPATPFATLGISVKWCDLYRRIDQLVDEQSAVGSYLPPILEIYSRLGDRTAAYLNTKYVAENSKLPVYFTPFKGSDMFAFSEKETLTGPRYYKRIVHLKNEEQINSLQRASKTDSTLYLLPFFPHTRDLSKEKSGCSYINYTINWETFRPRVKELLTVIKPHAKLDIPKNAYTIALHIRDGGLFDDDNTKTLHPLKLPDGTGFYEKELERLLNSVDIPEGKAIYIHIFTDACEPKTVYDRMQKVVDKYKEDKNITLHYTPKNEISLVNDVANMDRFDCMIRADSNLSGPIITGSDKTTVQIYPSGFQESENFKTIAITQVTIAKRTPKGAVIELHKTNYQKKVAARLPGWFIRRFWEYYAVHRSV